MREERVQSQTVPGVQPSHSPWRKLETNCPGVRWILWKGDLGVDTEAMDGDCRASGWKNSFIC